MTAEAELPDRDIRAEERLLARLRDLGSVVVAFSGGADSALLLAAAVRALGPDNVIAATGISSSLPQSERGPAADFVASLGVRLLLVETHELDRDGYRENTGNRCYFCKSELIEVLAAVAANHGMAHVATGTNADDAVAGFRPGIAAAAKLGAVTPLLDAGLTKDQVRRMSRDWGLPTWDKPAAACLASRIAYGIEVSRDRLERVEQVEAELRAALHSEGISVANLRVRDLGTSARIEVDLDVVDQLNAKPELQAKLLVKLLADAGGWTAITIDPRGFRSGSMNELLPIDAR